MTTYVMYVSDANYSQLLSIKSEQVFQNKKKIIKVLDELKMPASSYRIKDYLDKKTSEENKVLREEAKSMYENGWLSSSERNEYVKKKTKKSLSLRTIQRYLPKLEKEGVLGHQSNEYFIQFKGVYFAQDFGGFVSDTMMKTHYPTLYTIDKNLRRLIELFGVYVICCFTEAARPLEGKMFLESAADNDRLSHFWAKEMIDAETLYRHFLAAMQNQPDNDKDVKRNLKGLEADEKIGLVDYYGKKIFWPPTTADFSRELFYKIPYSLENYPTQPLYALDHNKINKITAFLQKYYPLFNSKLEDFRKRYGKENILNLHKYVR